MMFSASPSVKSPADHDAAVIELIQSDLRQLSNDTRKRFGPIKEAAESAILKIKTLSSAATKSKSSSPLDTLRQHSNTVLQPFLMGCDTKVQDICLLCVSGIQRLITHQIVSPQAGANIVSMLAQLMEWNFDSIRILQTSMLLLSTTTCVRGKTLSNCLALCFRLLGSGDFQVNHTASAIIRQAVCTVLDRIDAPVPPANGLVYPYRNKETSEKVKQNNIEDLDEFGQDGCRLFLDLCLMSCGDEPKWLVALDSESVHPSFCLEMMEVVLNQYVEIFFAFPQFIFLLKENVCNIVIKNFSPKWNLQSQLSIEAKVEHYVIATKILKVVAIMLERYNSVLKTESEIFLSFLIKFLSGEQWQQAIAVEVLHKICWKPRQLRDICQQYDLQNKSNGSTPVFQELINALASVTSSKFHRLYRNKEDPESPSDSEILDDLSINKLILNSETQASTERNEIPFVSEDYVLRMSMSCLLDIATAIIDLGDKELIKRRAANVPIHEINETENTLRQMIMSGWSGLLQTLSLLFEAAPDENTVNSVLDLMTALTAVAGGLNMDSPREALVGTLCRFALPPGYHEKSYAGEQTSGGQVLVVGQPLTASTSSGAGFVLLTTRNIQVLRALLDVASDYGPLLGQSWSLVLSALQHLSWILGFQCSITGEMTAKVQENGQSTVLTTAISQEIPKISKKLADVFENSSKLDEVALHHLVNAICELSTETMDQAYGSATREPSLFAVANLVQVSITNLNRLEVIWRLVTGHLLEVCQHTNMHFRKVGAEGISHLITSAFAEDSIFSNQRRQEMVLAAFSEMSTIPKIDVRTRQMQCVLEVLESRGEKLTRAWPVLLEIIQASCEALKDQALNESVKLNRQLSVTGLLEPSSPSEKSPEKNSEAQKSENHEREVLVKSGFRAIKLVVTDFLATTPSEHLQLIIQSTMRFGTQQQSLNISLTAIGLLWTIVDFLCHDFDEENDDKLLQNLWIALYHAIGVLCVDPRPSVRKSAGQTLFGTIAAHGGSLKEETWRRLFWEILFPILENAESVMQEQEKTAKSAKASNFLVHHSRDTAEKQWAETKRLTLQGLTKLFKDNKSGLNPAEWVRCWKGMLQYIEEYAFSDNKEVSGGALEAFKELLEASPDLSNSGKIPETNLQAAIIAAWQVWISICDKSLLKYEGSQNPQNVPRQEFLQSWAELLPLFTEKLGEKMSSEQMESVCEMLVRIISVPVLSDALPFLFTGCGDDANLTNLQKIILSNIISLQKLAVYKTINNVYPQIFGLLSAMLTLCYKIPSFDPMNARLEAEGKRNRWIFANPEKLGNHLMKSASDLYQKVACDRSVIKNSILGKLIKTLLPFWDMKEKSSLWTVAHKVFISILSTGLPVVRQFAASITDEDVLWRTVVHSFQSFLIENVWENEHAALHLELSCKTALLIKSEILVYRASYSKEFIDNVTLVLEKGQQQQERDDFSKLCFEMASGISNESKVDENSYEDIIKLVENIRLGRAEENQQLAVISRCTSLIRKIREKSDEHMLTELAFFLQACRAILQNIVKDQRGSSQMTMKLYELYPVLCNLIQKCPQQLLEPLSHALLAYQPFLSSE